MDRGAWQATVYGVGKESDMTEQLTYICIKCTTSRVNSNISYGLWVIMMYQCRLISGNQCITLMGDSKQDCGSDRIIYGKLLYSLFTFAMDLKLL